MSPLSVARDPDQAIAFLRDVVGYGRLPGETSPIETFADLQDSERAAILAWYWPSPVYDENYDPVAELASLDARPHDGRDPQLAVRALASVRLNRFVLTAAMALTRQPDELVGALCWKLPLSGDHVTAVLEGNRGVTFQQFLAVLDTLGVQYIDPADHDKHVSTWTSVVEDLHGKALEALRKTVQTALDLAACGYNVRVADAVTKYGSKAAPPASPVWDRMYDQTLSLDVARHALEDRDRLSDPLQTGSVLVDLLLLRGDPDRVEAVDLLSNSLARAPEALSQAIVSNPLAGVVPDPIRWVIEQLTHVAEAVAVTDPDGLGAEDAFGWLILDRTALGPRIDKALAELASVDDARAAIRKATGHAGSPTSITRPGDSYDAPAIGSRYRPLFEALAACEKPAPYFTIDPEVPRLSTDQGWIDLPQAAASDRNWWSGSGQSATGRPQVRAWRAAGYGTPTVVTRDDGRVATVWFHSLRGRDDWLRALSVEQRLAAGRFTVPEASTIPYHASVESRGPSVWQMGEDQYANLGQSITGASLTATGKRSMGARSGRQRQAKPSSHTMSTDELASYLLEHGEAGRREIEEFLGANLGTVSERRDLTRRLDNLLTNARRKRAIVNIGGRKEPRWVAFGTPAHLAGRLAHVLSHNPAGTEKIRRVPAPHLAPGERVPPELYRRVIRHVFPNVTPEPASPSAQMTDEYEGTKCMTDAAMAAVLAGRELNDHGVKVLLDTIDVSREQARDAAVPAPPMGTLVYDEAEILTLAEE